MDILAKINWSLVLYVISSLIAVVVGSNQLYSFGMGTATIYAIGSTLIFVLFGYRWFSKPVASITWPPNINMCPDYLTFVKTIAGLPNGGCVDTLGVSTGGFSKIEPSAISSVAKTDRLKVFEYTAKDVSKATTSEALQEICTRCYNAGLTWEGVFDGDTCVAIKTVDAKSAALANCVAKV